MNLGADMICLVQCTSPFLSPTFLQKAYNLMTEMKYDSIFSVYRSHSLRWSQDLQPLNFNPKCRPRRQEWTGIQFPEHCMHVMYLRFKLSKIEI